MRAKIIYRKPPRVEEKREIRIRYSMDRPKEEKTKNEFQWEIHFKIQFCPNKNMEERTSNEGAEKNTILEMI